MDKEAPSTEWPRWFFGPKGESEQFDSENDVPTGWKRHPSEHKAGSESKAPEGGPTKNDAGEEIDAFGLVWSADINTADKAMTKGGLWKMQPGKSRPAPAEGFPKETFDL